MSVRGAALVGLVLAAIATTVRASPAAEAEPVAYAGDDVCVACHESQAASYAKTPHGTALADPARPEGMRGCEACHGPGQAHAEAGGGKGVGGLETFARHRPATDRARVCLECHAAGEDLHDWKASAHARAAVACTECHRMHGGTADHLLAKPTPGVCYGCHLDVRAKLALPEHHKVDEGVVRCEDCHRPHGSRARRLMRGDDERTCFRCHADVQGPFVFEHAALVTEGCARCHDPHGSPNRHLLVRQQVAQLCFECHAVTPPSHVQPSFRDCTRCHVDIHGSNTDPRFLER
ncbi:MAG TPA: DmsE family decaheme c-type cytochrome [Candidatus Binatia bacterium]|nr:DmsE family decaheme c-type cytochrome [Candidatus Binatia bacterium]